MPDSVAALTRGDVLDAHKATMTRDRMYVSAVGDISAVELGPLLDRLLGDLPALGRQMPSVVGERFLEVALDEPDGRIEAEGFEEDRARPLQREDGVR